MPLATNGGNNVGSAQIIDNSIIDDDINAAAGIKKSKLSEFGEIKTFLPKPCFPFATTALYQGSITGNTTAYVQMIHVPTLINVNSISMYVSAVTTAGTVDISLYSEDGQTRIFSITSGNISATGVLTLNTGAIKLEENNYYLLINANGTLSINSYAWDALGSAGFNNTGGLAGEVTGKKKVQGTLVITADTPPATIDPTALTYANRVAWIFRLDN